MLQDGLFGPILKAQVSDQLKLNARYARMRLDQRRLEDFSAFLETVVAGEAGLAAQAASEGLDHVRPALAAFAAWAAVRLPLR